MESGRLLTNVTLLSLAIDSATFGLIRIRDDDTGDVYTLPCGYVMLTETGGEEESHHYLSTACLHGLHAECGRAQRGRGDLSVPHCKHCSSPCACIECSHVLRVALEE